MSAFVVTTADGQTQILGIGNIPGRIRTALYITDGSVTKPVAYFRSRKDACRADALLRDIARGEMVE